MNETGLGDRVEQCFSYRPAPISGPLSVRVGPEAISVDGKWTLRIADLEAAAFSTIAFGDSRMARLDLYTRKAGHSLSCNNARTGGADNHDAAQHRGAVVAALRAIASARPEMMVTLGPTRGASRGMFVAGLCSALAGAGLAVAAFVTGVSGDRLVAAALPVGLLLLVGAGMMGSHWPWRSRLHVSPGALADTLVEKGVATSSPSPANDGVPR